MGLELPEDLPFDGWERKGFQLGEDRSRCLWKIGDWWIFGERYDTRRYSVPDHFGVNYHTCEKCAVVARAFSGFRRRKSLSFSHHAEVATLPPREADLLLDWCEESIAANGRPRSRRELRAKRDEMRREEVHRQVDKLNIAKEDASRRFSASIAMWVEPAERPRPVSPFRAAEPSAVLDNSEVSGLVPDELRKLQIEPEPESSIPYNLATIATAINALSCEELSELAGRLRPEKKAALCGCAVDPGSADHFVWAI